MNHSDDCYQFGVCLGNTSFICKSANFKNGDRNASSLAEFWVLLGKKKKTKVKLDLWPWYGWERRWLVHQKAKTESCKVRPKLKLYLHICSPELLLLPGFLPSHSLYIIADEKTAISDFQKWKYMVWLRSAYLMQKGMEGRKIDRLWPGVEGGNNE